MFDLDCRMTEVVIGDDLRGWVGRATARSRTGLIFSVGRYGELLGIARDRALDELGNELKRRFDWYGSRGEP